MNTPKHLAARQLRMAVDPPSCLQAARDYLEGRRRGYRVVEFAAAAKALGLVPVENDLTRRYDLRRMQEIAADTAAEKSES